MANSKISVENLNLHYGENHALKDVNMEIADHAITAFIGPSGCGKSTLLQALGGLDAPTSGKVLLEGQDLYALPDAALARLRRTRLGFVFQAFHLLPEYTVRDNILLPLLLAVGSAFIWDFEVTGNDTVPTESVLQALERCGVRVGTRGVGLDQDELRNRVLPLLPDVVYLAVNVKGCTAHVQVVERVRPPHLYRDSDVQNIVAARDGLITKIEALDGVTCAAVGETVQAGQVLLSGVADSPRGCRYMRATGRIWARTWYEWTVPVPLETVLKDGTEPVKTRTHTALDLGRHRIALPAGDSILQGRENCDKIIRYRGVQLPFGLRLPVTLVTETVAERAVYDGERPEDEARAEGQKQLEARLAQTIGDDGRVLKADVSARRQGAYLMVTLWAECEEQIGVDAPLTITSDTGR